MRFVGRPAACCEERQGARCCCSKSISCHPEWLGHSAPSSWNAVTLYSVASKSAACKAVIAMKSRTVLGPSARRCNIRRVARVRVALRMGGQIGNKWGMCTELASVASRFYVRRKLGEGAEMWKRVYSVVFCSCSRWELYFGALYLETAF